MQPQGYVVKDAGFGGRGRGNQWLGGRSLPVHPIGMVSLRQQERRMVPSDVTPKRPGKPYPGSKIRIRVPSFGAVSIGCQFGNMAPAPVPGKRRTAYVVPALGQLSTPIHDVLTASVDRCVAASSRPDQPNASPVASEGPYLPSRVITLPITKKSPILAELERPQRGRHRCQQCP